MPIRIFELITQGDRISNLDYQLLTNNLRRNNDCFCTANIDTAEPQVIEAIIEQRSHLLQLVYPEILQTLALHNIQL
ncbi:MAG: glycerate kinase, partial [Pseudanabaena sp. CAN_BIN31]|nr:glycerate kinase [Pseudanabaena sp. CAN_BIN31]